GDTNLASDVFVHDMKNGITTRVDVSSSSGDQANDGVFEYLSVNATGRYIAFESNASNLVPHDTNGHVDVFVHDMKTRKTEIQSVSAQGVQGDDTSVPGVSLGPNGRYVVFGSSAGNLVSGDTNQGVNGLDVFLRDRLRGTI